MRTQGEEDKPAAEAGFWTHPGNSDFGSSEIENFEFAQIYAGLACDVPRHSPRPETMSRGVLPPPLRLSSTSARRGSLNEGTRRRGVCTQCRGRTKRDGQWKTRFLEVLNLGRRLILLALYPHCRSMVLRRIDLPRSPGRPERHVDASGHCHESLPRSRRPGEWNSDGIQVEFWWNFILTLGCTYANEIQNRSHVGIQ